MAIRRVLEEVAEITIFDIAKDKLSRVLRTTGDDHSSATDEIGAAVQSIQMTTSPARRERP